MEKFPSDIYRKVVLEPAYDGHKKSKKLSSVLKMKIMHITDKQNNTSKKTKNEPIFIFEKGIFKYFQHRKDR